MMALGKCEIGGEEEGKGEEGKGEGREREREAGLDGCSSIGKVAQWRPDGGGFNLDIPQWHLVK